MAGHRRHPRRTGAAAAAARLFHGARRTVQAQGKAAKLITLLALGLADDDFMVLYSRYRSTRLVLIIMGNIPLALVGSVRRIGFPASRCRWPRWWASSP